MINADKARAIFMELLGDVPPEQWGERLAGLAAGDEGLRRHVELLLQAHRDADSFLERPANGPGGTGAFTASPAPEDATGPAEGPGTIIGPYKLLQAIGEGGMGAVFLAEQQEPVRRQVALKLIKPGMDSRQVVARFEAERQALALMEHPNIARVLDGGATESGRPYFVMELVKGVPVTTYCDEQRLTPRQRLELFVPVCEAVQHAHQKGVIHRDLKPSNVLAALYDGRPVPKVIDFGVAKAAGQPLTDKTLFTGLGAVVGTLEYMSPEQAQLNQLDIDTRSDVYSLGVLLYELLTGTTPLERRRLKDTGLLELLRLIREEEPPRPSARLSTTAELPAIAARRGLEPKRLSGAIRGELDWIVMKALEKDRGRRYETANALALDLRRYLADEPVQAFPPSAWYRLRKIGRRNWGVLSAAALVLLALVAGTAVSAWQAVRATQAYNGEREKQKKLDDARDEKEQQRARTDRDLNAALVEAAGQLEKARAARPGDAGPWTRLRETLGRATTLAESDLADPVLVGRVQALLTESSQDEANRRMVARLEEIYLNAGPLQSIHETDVTSGPAYEAAFRDYGLPVLDLDVEEAARRIAASPIRDELVDALDGWSDYRRPQLLQIARRAENDPWRVQYFNARIHGDRATLVRLAQQPETLAQPPGLLYRLASPMGNRADLPTAVQLLRAAQQRHPADVRVNYSLGVLLGGSAFEHSGDEQLRYLAESVGFLRVALAARPESAGLRETLAMRLTFMGEKLCFKPEQDALEAALRCYSEAIGLQPEQTELRLSRAKVYFMLGRPGEAMPDYTKVVELQPDRPESWTARARGYQMCGQHDKAVADFTRVIEMCSMSGSAWFDRGEAYGLQGQWDKAVADYTEAIELDPTNPRNWTARASAYLRLHSDKAVADYTKAIELQPNDLHFWMCRADAYEALGQSDKALADFSKAVELFPTDKSAWSTRGSAYQRRGQPDKAVADFSKAIELDPNDVGARYSRGDTYRRLGRRDDALADYSRAIEATPGHFHLMALLGRAGIYGEMGQWGRAVEDYSQVLKQSPQFANGFYSRARAYEVLGEHDKAVADYTKAIELQPNDLQLWMGRARAYEALGQPDKALADFSKAVELFPTDKSAWSTRGRVYQRRGQPDKAVADFSKAIELDPNDVGARQCRGDTYRQLGRRGDALADYSRAIEAAPGHFDWMALVGRAVIYSEMRQWDRAVEDYSQLLKQSPQFADGFYKRGYAYQNLRMWDKAVTDYEKAVELDPTPGIWNDLARLLATCPESKVRNPARAVELAGKAVEQLPRDIRYWETLGIAHYRAGEWQAAVDALNKSEQLLKGDPVGCLFLAMARQKLDDPEEARKQYDRAVRLQEGNRQALEKDPERAEELRRIRDEAEEILGLKSK
jgi:tetratricopeptide (TPR) repeat protein